MNPYETLDVKEDCTIDEIKIAYKKFSKIFHPDVNNGNSNKFIEINLSYRVLSNPEKRKMYDEQGVILDESPDHIKTLVRTRLSMIANHWIDSVMKGNPITLKEFVLEGLGNATNKISKADSDIEKTIEKLNEISKRLTHKSGKTIVHKIIDQRLSLLNKAKVQNKTELMVINKVKKEIMEYEYEEEIINVMQFGSTSSSTTSTTSW